MVTTARAIECMQRRERIVFILLDGRRTIQDIARLIHQPEAEVEQILVQLTNSGYIQYIQG
jgi:predicted ArsR family transcriptional regulator